MQNIIPERIAQVLKLMNIEAKPSSWNIEDNHAEVKLVLHWSKGKYPRFSCHPRPKSERKIARDTARSVQHKKHQCEQPNCSTLSIEPVKPKTTSRSTESHITRYKSSECQVTPKVNDSSIQTTSSTKTQAIQVNSSGNCSGEENRIAKTSQHIKGSIEKRVSECEFTKCVAFLAKELPITEKFLRKRVINDKQEYLIKWTGLPSSKNSWISEDKLDSSAKVYILAGNNIPGAKAKHRKHNFPEMNIDFQITPNISVPFKRLNLFDGELEVRIMRDEENSSKWYWENLHKIYDTNPKLFELIAPIIKEIPFYTPFGYDKFSI